MGTEQEHAVYADDFRQSRIASSLSRDRADLVPDGLDTMRLGMMLGNGGGFYIDVGDHPEMCSAEAFGPMGATIVKVASSSVMRTMVANLRQREGGITDGEYVLANVSDGHEAWGYHINQATNVSLGRTLHDFSEVRGERVLSPLLMTMIGGISLWSAGRVPERGRYEYFQKSRLIYDMVGPQTTKFRPLVAPRREPLADPRESYRLHIVGNDALHSPWATWLRLGMYEVATTICETQPKLAREMWGYLPDGGYRNVALNSIMRRISRNPTTALFDSNDGKRRNPLNLLEEVIATAEDLIEKGDMSAEGLDIERRMALNEAEYGYDQAKDPDSTGLDYLVDSHLRPIVHRKLEKGGYFEDQAQQHGIDKLLDDVERQVPGSRIFQELLEKAGWARLADVYKVPSARLIELVEKYTTEPYPGRPTLRAEIVKRYGPANERRSVPAVNGPAVAVAWNVWKLADEEHATYMNDPYEGAKVFPFWNDPAA